MQGADPSVAFRVGLAGVDIFFVISGFIMWIMAEKAYPSPGEFIRKRVIRIVPLYWALTFSWRRSRW